jgi:hypothetical protein
MSLTQQQIDLIHQIAKENAKFITPLREEDECDLSTDGGFLRLEKKSSGEYTVTASRPLYPKIIERAEILERYFTNCILPNVEKGINLTGYYQICLYDADHHPERLNYLVFSKKDSQSKGLLPDYYQIIDYALTGKPTDPYQWNEKFNASIFAGSTTGKNDPFQNDRINACLWAREHRDIARWYITSVVQINPSTLVRGIGYDNLSSIMHRGITIPEQLQYRFIFSIPGNVNRWDNDVWAMSSNSVLLRKTTEFKSWYNYLLKPEEHYIDIHHHTEVPEQMTRVNSYHLEKVIVPNGKKFVADYCYNRVAPILYTKFLFEEINCLHGA